MQETGHRIEYSAHQQTRESARAVARELMGHRVLTSLRQWYYGVLLQTDGF